MTPIDSNYEYTSFSGRIYNSQFLSLEVCYLAYPSHEVVKLPNLSPTMEVGTIISWEKAEGERIEEGEVLAIIETDKSTMEMETPDEGYLAKIIMPVGSKDIPVNQVTKLIFKSFFSPLTAS